MNTIKTTNKKILTQNGPSCDSRERERERGRDRQRREKKAHGEERERDEDRERRETDEIKQNFKIETQKNKQTNIKKLIT